MRRLGGFGALIAMVGCSGSHPSNASFDTFIGQIQAMPPDQARSYVAGHQDEVKAVLADPRYQKKYLAVVIAKMPKNGLRR